LRNLCLKYNVTFIVDEVQTGLSTGKMWGHEYWNLEHKPDIITFAKKCQMAGFIAHEKYRPKYG